MALEVATGSITVTTGAAGTTFTVSGLSFQPKAVVLFWSGRATVGQAEADVRLGLGIFTGTSSRRAFACQWDHAKAAPHQADEAWYNDCCIATLTVGGTIEGKADVNAINSDGFQLVIDDTFATALVVGWLAIGGDASQAEIVDFTFDANAADQDIVTSFALDTGEDDKLVLLFGGINKAVNTPGGSFGRLNIGVAAGDTIVDAHASVIQIDATASTTDTASHANQSGSLVSPETTTGGPAAITVSQWNSNGFRVGNFASSVTGTVRVSALVLKGGRYEVGTLTTSTGTTNQAEATTYQPKGLFLVSCNRSSSGSPPSATAEISIGAAVSATQRCSAGALAKDAAATSDCGTATDSDNMYSNQSTAATIAVEGLMDLVSLDSTPGFTWVMDDADPAGSFVWYVSFASVPAYTATAALTTGNVTLAATATHVRPTYTGTASLTTGPATLSASATHAPPTYTATSALVAGNATLSAAATFVASTTFTATAALTAANATLASTATFVAPVYTGTAALVTSDATLAASAQHTTPVYTATAALLVSDATLAASAQHTTPIYTGTASLTASPATLAASAVFTAPIYTATSALTVANPTLAASAQHAPPIYTATAALVVSNATLAAAGLTGQVFSGIGTLTAQAATLTASATFVAPVYTASAALLVSNTVLASSATHIAPVYAGTAALVTGSATLVTSATFAPLFVGVATLLAGNATLAATATYTISLSTAVATLVTQAATISVAAIFAPFPPEYRERLIIEAGPTRSVLDSPATARLILNTARLGIDNSEPTRHVLNASSPRIAIDQEP